MRSILLTALAAAGIGFAAPSEAEAGGLSVRFRIGSSRCDDHRIRRHHHRRHYGHHRAHHGYHRHYRSHRVYVPRRHHHHYRHYRPVYRYGYCR